MAIKALVVDQIHFERELLASALRLAGYEVSEASGIKEALKMVDTIHPHIVLTEVVLMDASGFELCKRVKKDPLTSEIAVLMVTHKTQESDKFWAHRMGADGYICKPWSIDAVLAAIRSLHPYPSWEREILDAEISGAGLAESIGPLRI